MKLAPKHKCGPTKLWCFECRTPICEQCMIKTKDSLRCAKCSPERKATAKVKLGWKQTPQVAFAAGFYSLIATSLITAVAPYSGLTIYIISALIGVGIATLLKRNLNGPLSKNARISAIIGLIVGSALSAGLTHALNQQPLSWFLFIPDLVTSAIILIAVLVRFR